MSEHTERQAALADAVRNTDLIPLRAIELPDAVTDYFMDQSKKCVGTSTHPELFFDIFAATSSGITSYIGHHMKHHDDGLAEEEVYVCDTTASGNVAGFGTVRMQHNPILEGLAHVPYIGYTRTQADHSADYRGMGLGARRLVLMDVASRLVLNGPVHSGERPEPAALRIWQRFEAAGLAARVAIAGNERFRFL